MVGSSMEHCDEEIPSKRPKLSDGGDGGRSKDRLSALPDDILIHILLKLLDTAVAARTSVLSNRWRHLWKQLPSLWFRSSTDPIGIRSALKSHEAPALHHLDVSVNFTTPKSMEVWLQIAARRLSGDLEFTNETKGEAPEGGPLELPCFENATSIRLELGYLGLAVPLLGVFTGLTNLFLASIKLRGPCMLGDVVSSPRCPSLRMLTVDDAWDAGNFIIHSESLEQLKLRNLHGLQQLTIMAPALKLLRVISCFVEGSSNNQPVANISTPQLVSLGWMDVYDPRFVHFGKMENLQWLTTGPFIVYGHDDDAHKFNSSCRRLIRHVELKLGITFMLFYPPNITNHRYMMGDITRLPNITRMALIILSKGHSFGASLFHVLRICTSVRKLLLTVDGTSCPEVQPGCPSGCVCDHPSNWKTEELVLNSLRAVKIQTLRGTEHEAALIKRLFDWAIALEKMIITFHCSVTESEAKEFFQMLQSFSRPEICMEGPHFT